MNRFTCLALAALPLVAACDMDRSGLLSNGSVTRLTGAETRSVADAPRVVPAGLSSRPGGTQMELATADGGVLTGLLTMQQQPVIVPLADSSEPLVGGGTVLAGEVAGDGMVLNCRFRLLNPPRGVDGGGAGRCEGSGRQVDFVF